jgi:hypothetical protein
VQFTADSIYIIAIAPVNVIAPMIENFDPVSNGFAAMARSPPSVSFLRHLHMRLLLLLLFLLVAALPFLYILSYLNLGKQ